MYGLIEWGHSNLFGQRKVFQTVKCPHFSDRVVHIHDVGSKLFIVKLYLEPSTGYMYINTQEVVMPVVLWQLLEY